MNAAKERLGRMSQLEMMNYLGVIMAPSGLNMATGLAPTWQAFNVVISNVPGPKKPLYFNGARMEGTYPVSIVLDGQALNITLTSYGDDMEVGLIACRRTLPHMQKLLQYLEDGLAELEQLAARSSKVA
jgi:diacylglycerol O-acyltransferase